MAKKRVGKFPTAFRQMAVDRLNQCENIVTLAKELGVSRRLLYTWREKLEPSASGAGPPANAREATLRKEVSRLKKEGQFEGLFEKCASKKVTNYY